jgi:hypothetical protein
MTEPEKFISVPADWNEDKDRAYFEERFGESKDYRDVMATYLNKAFAELNEVLDEVVGYFTQNLEIAGLIGPALTPREKIEWLTELVLDIEDRANVRDRLLESLAHCAWAHHERYRLLFALRRPFSLTWVAPLCDVTDSMGAAGAKLEESMICEYQDYDGARIYHSPLPKKQAVLDD